ncbi:AMP-dependent synthetase and ligase [Caballeronia choica]|jgi:fatty-acyl-CoA synthase|uniref:AMP-dependent synthetase and ligase n=1 Tax=Caballeronia choica TaxID=326476 RepID=A0A158KT52_9BURK|nr:acyl-CoA synthetase [Caballeronia choica]SAL84155.1 AMP-dependent synthetase and ligase [Caballeronia choica]
MNRVPKYLGDHAELTPEKPAAINGTTGDILTYRELDERSNRFAQCLHAFGLRRGDHIAMVLENNMRCFELCWAALRSGLMITPVNRFLTASEAAYIIEDSHAQVVVSSYALRELAAELTGIMPTCRLRLMIDGTIPGWVSYETQTAGHAASRLADEWLGAAMIYSSGTTGRPKGIIRAQPNGKVTEGSGSARRPQFERYGFDAQTVYLSPAPLYHTAPLGYGLETQFGGGTVVFMEKFDALEALAMIERYRVTHSQWVPTMLIRLLRLAPEQRGAFDLSSHRVAIHAAAPCPQDVKRQMIDWWGPILHEYYSSTEGNGVTTLDTPEWLAHPGSVGRALLGVIHICDDEGNELATGETGLVYFEREQLPFHYHNDPDKTRAAMHPRHPGWSAVGDVGRVDADGYLYLTDRRAFMIISGGVNIYPQAIEDALAVHPSVADAAVIGVPDAEMGEEVRAIVEPASGVEPTVALAGQLLAYLRTKVARYMVPRSIDFIDAMPRLPTGKLYKQALRDRYLADAAGPGESPRAAMTSDAATPTFWSET